MQLTKSLRISNSVVAMNGNDKFLLMIDNKYVLYVVDTVHLKIIKKIPIQGQFEPRHPYDKSFSISKDFYITIGTSRTNKSHVMRYDESLQQVITLNFNDKPLSFSRFSPDNSVLTLGGEDGKTFFFNVPSRQLIGSIRTFPDFISSIAYSQDMRLIAISSFDKTTVIYNLACNVIVGSFTSDFAVESSMFVNNDQKIIGLTRHKSLILFELGASHPITSLFELNDWPTSIIAMGKKHVVVGTKGSDLYIIDMDHFQIAKQITLHNLGVTQMAFLQNMLYISFINGEIEIIDTHMYLKEFLLHLRINEFDKASIVMDKNPFLLTQEMMKKYDKIWPSIFDRAKQLVIDGKIEEAYEMAKPFFVDQEKQKEFNFFYGNRNLFEQLNELIEKKAYVEAHMLCDEHIFLKQTREYEVLDRHWIKLFQACKLLFAKNDSASHASAKATLKNYINVPSKKNMIEKLSVDHKIFSKSDEYIRKRNFKAYFDLIEQNPFLKSEDLYNRVLQVGYQTFTKLKSLEMKEKYDDAIKVAFFLKDFTPLKDKAIHALEEIGRKKEIFEAIENQNITFIYNTVNKHPDLLEFVPLINFHKEYLRIEAMCWELSKEGNVTEIINQLHPYTKGAYTRHSVARVIKEAYLAEIRIECETNRDSIDFEKTIQMYNSFFGLDNELFYIAKICNFEELLVLNDKIGNERGYETKSYPPTLIVRKENP